MKKEVQQILGTTNSSQEFDDFHRIYTSLFSSNKFYVQTSPQTTERILKKAAIPYFSPE